ncbi:Uma2 family endonuclease, partial [Actinomadura kijaniata]|uniref:Uma2 family endonuclease n=1 Tax=Actinomadura kijaniata TaxID=46161 RepID=UPI003F1BD150
LRLPSGGSRPENHVFPDATFAPREKRLFRGAPTWMLPDGVALVAEVTGDTSPCDRVTKRHCYARAGIPLYLLVDRDDSTVTLFAEPARA